MFSSTSFHATKRPRSSTGIPSISAITIIGSGTAKSAATSISPRLITRSSNCRDSSRIRGSRFATERGVNPFEINARSFVCRGGSVKIVQSPLHPGIVEDHPNPRLRLAEQRRNAADLLVQRVRISADVVGEEGVHRRSNAPGAVPYVRGGGGGNTAK